jgi:spore coat protein U-like protein
MAPIRGEPTRDVQKLAQRALRWSCVLCLAAMAAACLPPLRAVAATATDTKAAGVMIVVPAKCQVVAGPVLFGVNGGPAEIARSAVSISCTVTTLFNVQLDPVAPAPAHAAGHRVSLITGVAPYALTVAPAAGSGLSLPDGTDSFCGSGSATPMILEVTGQSMKGRWVKPLAGRSAVTISLIF